MTRQPRPHMRGKQFETYYHGTSSDNLPSILKQGLVPQLPGSGSVFFDGDEGDEMHPKGVYITKDLETARDYGDAVLEVQVERKHIGYSPETSHEFSTVRIPPHRIKQLEDPEA